MGQLLQDDGYLRERALMLLKALAGRKACSSLQGEADNQGVFGLWEQSEREAHVARVERTAFALKCLCAQSLLQEALESHGVKVLMIKGLSLSLLLYDDLSGRAFGDLDLFVPMDDVFRAANLLASTGYKRLRPSGLSLAQNLAHVRYGKAQTWVVEGGGAQVDLHWRLLSNWIDADMLSFEEVWERRQVVIASQGQRWCTLGNEDIVVFLCLHGAQDGWSKLKQFIDLHQAMKVLKPDWRLVEKIAGRRWPLVERALEMTSLLLTGGLTRRCPQWFSGEEEALEHWLHQATAHKSPQSKLLSPRLWRCGAGEKFCRIGKSFLTPAIDDIESVDLPYRLISLYPLVRVARLLRKFVERRGF